MQNPSPPALVGARGAKQKAWVENQGQVLRLTVGDQAVAKKKRGQVSFWTVGTCCVVGMPRPHRVDEAFGIYHALIRGKHYAAIFQKERVNVAFEKILVEGLKRFELIVKKHDLTTKSRQR